MYEAEPSGGRQLADLLEEVRALSARMDELEGQVRALTEAQPRRDAAASEQRAGGAAVGEQAALSSAEENGVPTAAETLEQLNAPNFLSTVAMVSFLLVVALVLRTIVDYGVVHQRVGSYLGLGYAALLMAYGNWAYRRSPSRAPVLASCGALLAFAILYEAHSHFEVLSAPAVYVFLALVLAAMGFSGLRHHAAAPLGIGVVGATAVAMGLEYPNPLFLYVAGVLFLANCVAHVAARVPRAGWVRGYMLFLTLFFWLFWCAKVRVPLLKGEVPVAELALPWLLPCLVVFACGYGASVVWSALRAEGPLGYFESILPLVNVLWAYTAAQAVVSAQGGRVGLVGGAGVLFAIGHLALALWFSSRGREDNSRAAAAFVAGGLVLLALSLRAAVGHPSLTLLLWSACALCLVFLPLTGRNRAVHALSHLFQLHVCAAAFRFGCLAAGETLPGVRVAAAAVLCVLCLIHYVRGRNGSLRPAGDLFVMMSSLVLLVAAVYAFSAARMVLHSVLTSLELKTAFQCGQTILMNTGALVLMVSALRWRNGEVLGVAVVAAGLGAAKVFGYDIFVIQDLPLVLSVSSFGITAGAGSLVWSRWQRQSANEPGLSKGRRANEPGANEARSAS